MQYRFVSTKPLDEVIDQARRDVKAWETAFTSLGGSPDSVLRIFSQDQCKALKDDPEATRQYLLSPDSSLRMAATFLVYVYWRSNPLFASPCLALAFGDVEPPIRGIALHALYHFYAYVDDPTGMLKAVFKAILPTQSEGIDAIVADCKKMIADMRAKGSEKLSEELTSLAGPKLQDMLRSRTETEAHLNSADPVLQYVALSLIHYHWKPTQRDADLCEKLCAGHTDVKVKREALRLLAAFYSSTNDVRIGKMVASIVTDESADLTVRKLAYRLLYDIRAMPALTWPKAKYEFPKDVDWSFVNSFSRE